MATTSTMPQNAANPHARPTLEVDVLIAGGGPCGLMLALELGKRGIRCLLVDPKPGTAFNPQANATQARTMEHFRRHGFAHEIRAQGLMPGHPTDIAYFTRFTRHELARLRLPTAEQATQVIKTMSGSWSAAELPHRVSQKFVEATLLKHVQDLPSVDLRFGHEMHSFEEHQAGVEACITVLSDQTSFKVNARYLVGADGARSMVRQRLGFQWLGASGIKRDFMGGKMFAVYLKAPDFYKQLPHDKAWMYVTVNSQRRAFMATVDGRGEFAFHAAIHDGEDAENWTAADAQRIFDQAMGVHLPIEVLSVCTWTAGHALYADHFQTARVFLAGDAAHLFTPTGGLGYNTAIDDAVNLGWKLASVVQGVAPPSLLDSYGLERQPVAQRNTGYARQFADSVGLYVAPPTLEDDTDLGLVSRQSASDHLNAHVRLEFNIPGVTFGARYDGSPIIVSDGTLPPPAHANQYTPSACPGGRPPHYWFDNGESLFDRFGFEWTLLNLGPNTHDAQEFKQAAQTLGIQLTVVTLDSPELRALYQSPLTLIRPDQVVAWRGAHSVEVEVEAEAIFRQVLGFHTLGHRADSAATGGQP